MQPPESVKWSLGHGEQDAKRIYLDREMHKMETIHNEIHRRTQKTKKATLKGSRNDETKKKAKSRKGKKTSKRYIANKLQRTKSDIN